jgi:hypothetical protein
VLRGSGFGLGELQLAKPLDIVFEFLTDRVLLLLAVFDVLEIVPYLAARFSNLLAQFGRYRPAGAFQVGSPPGKVRQPLPDFFDAARGDANNGFDRLAEPRCDVLRRAVPWFSAQPWFLPRYPGC